MVQLSDLQNTVTRARRSPMYAQKLENVNIPSSFEEFSQMPFTTKEDLRGLDSPYDLLACDEGEVVQLNTTSGTTGKPTLSFFSQYDLEEGSKYLAKAWESFGVTPRSRVQFIMSYGLFSGASLNTLALQRLGAFVIPAGIQPLTKQLQFIDDFQPDTLVATPSFYIYLFNTLEEKGELERLNKWSVKRGIAAGEIYSEETREFIEKRLGITIYDHYGLCELYSGFAHECSCRRGLHLIDGLVYGEIVDPETGRNVSDGEAGELVVTSIHKKASPILRYRTGDITRKRPSKEMCQCGCVQHTSYAIDRIHRRKDDLLFIKGIKVDPHAICDYLIRAHGDNLYPDIKIGIARSVDFYTPDIYLTLKDGVSESLLSKIQHELKEETFVTFMLHNKSHEFFERDSRNKSRLVIYKD